jgi:hypothetical protein
LANPSLLVVPPQRRLLFIKHSCIECQLCANPAGRSKKEDGRSATKREDSSQALVLPWVRKKIPER